MTAPAEEFYPGLEIQTPGKTVLDRHGAVAEKTDRFSFDLAYTIPRKKHGVRINI